MSTINSNKKQKNIITIINNINEKNPNNNKKTYEDLKKNKKEEKKPKDKNLLLSKKTKKCDKKDKNYEDEKYYCISCQKNYDKSSNLYRHLYQKHNTIIKEICPACLQKVPYLCQHYRECKKKHMKKYRKKNWKNENTCHEGKHYKEKNNPKEENNAENKNEVINKDINTREILDKEKNNPKKENNVENKNEIINKDINAREILDKEKNNPKKENNAENKNEIINKDTNEREILDKEKNNPKIKICNNNELSFIPVKKNNSPIIHESKNTCISLVKKNENSSLEKIIMNNIQNILLQNNLLKIGSNIIFEEFILGQGSYGQVYFGLKIKQENKKINYYPVAIKKQKFRSKIPFVCNQNFLNKEKCVMDSLKNNSIIFPKCLEQISYNNDHFIVEELLGPNLFKLHDFCGNFSIKTICKLGIQIIDSIKEIHQKGYLYLDLKEDNICILFDPVIKENKEINVSLIDFGFCTKYVDEEGKHLTYENGKIKYGNIYYSSINALQEKPVSRKDDIIMICYLLLNFRQKLPWPAYMQGDKEKYRKNIVNKKLLFNTRNYNEINEILEIKEDIDKKRYQDEPDYEKYKDLLNKLKNRSENEKSKNYNFDWEKKINSLINHYKNDEKKILNDKWIKYIFSGLLEEIKLYYIMKYK